MSILTPFIVVMNDQETYWSVKFIFIKTRKNLQVFHLILAFTQKYVKNMKLILTVVAI